MWQALHTELKDKNFTVLSVALDSREGAAKPWIDKAQPDHPALIDPLHYVADLYNMVNVNQALWIDESGHIVRPVEAAGVTEGFRQMDRQTGQVPAHVMADSAQVMSVYQDALRDWVVNGNDSPHALDPASARAQTSLPTETTCRAHAAFVMGQYLIASGNRQEGDQFVDEASVLHPESWAIWRQGAELDKNGLAATPAFWQRVDALGSKKYYEPIGMPGMPEP